MLILPPSPAGAAPAPAEAAPASEPAEPSATPASSTTPPSSTTAAAPPTTEWEEKREAATTTTAAASTPTSQVAEHDDYEDDSQENQLRRETATAGGGYRLSRHLRGAKCRIQREVELPGEPLSREILHQQEPAAVVTRSKERGRLAADLTGVRVGDESLDTGTGEYEAAPMTVGVRLLGDEQDHRAGVPGRVSGVPDLSQLPFTPDLQRHIGRGSIAYVWERHDGDLAARLGPHVAGDLLHQWNVLRRNHVCKVVHQPRRGGDLQPTLEQQRDQCRLKKGWNHHTIYGMRPSLVNGLAFILAVSLVSAACSSADGHTNNGSPGGARATPPASNGVATPVGTGVATGPSSGAGAATDSLAKVADASRILGSPAAKLWVIEVSDFQCPYCKQWHDDAYPMLIKDYVKTGKIRLAYVNFPLSMHQNARAAATAAMCAGAQDKFWPMHDALFASQSKWEAEQNPSATFESIAKSLGVDATSYRSCLSSPAIASLISGDQDRAQRGGVGSTPSFWVGSRMIEGAVPASAMRAAVDQALAAPPATATTGAPK